MRVSGIMPGGGGWACPAAAATVSKASASMARVACRYQAIGVREVDGAAAEIRR